MRALKISACLSACLMVVITVLGIAATTHGQIRKQVDFTISAPYKLRMANYLLPAGKYILRQVNENDLDLFALYRGDLMHSPIAMVRTVRIDYHTGYPDRTAMHRYSDESTGGPDSVITGWDIPGMDGWEIIAVVPRNNGHRYMARIR